MKTSTAASKTKIISLYLTRRTSRTLPQRLVKRASAMAMLFALDRRDAADEIRDLLATVDVVLLDRYVASNAAYTAARRGEEADGDAVAWVDALEFDRFGLPVPDRQVLLGTDPVLARSRATSRAAADSSRAMDAYERDTALQHATFAVYQGLAARSWRSPWTALTGSDDADVLAAQV